MPKILIVDDEKEAIEYMKLSLEKRGYEVILAFTGQEALNIYPKENPDVILLDLGLPDINGREILKEVKEKSPSIKVIVVSGYKDQKTKEELTQLGADYFLGKPVAPSQLYEQLRNVLNKKF
ncbi:MAG: response regulator [Candidatus Omnitrophica bacterium]|nr:response regulator [Candidatus Omnitrophota bacterium]